MLYPFNYGSVFRFRDPAKGGGSLRGEARRSFAVRFHCTASAEKKQAFLRGKSPLLRRTGRVLPPDPAKIPISWGTYIDKTHLSAQRGDGPNGRCRMFSLLSAEFFGAEAAHPAKIFRKAAPAPQSTEAASRSAEAAALRISRGRRRRFCA